MRFSLLFALLLSFGILHGQVNQSDLIFHHINERNGLSNNTINATLKDRKGFMWIATLDGLNRFDGSHFIIYRNNRDQPNSLHQNTVHSICTDKNDDIWCATQTSISRFDKKTQSFENFFPGDSKSGVSYNDVVCDADGTIWCSSTLGIYEYLPATKTFKNYNSNNSSNQSLTTSRLGKKDLTISPDGRFLWIATAKGMNQLDIKTKTIYNYKNNPKGLAVFDSLGHSAPCFDRNGNLVSGTGLLPKISQYQFTTNSITTYDILFSKKNNSRFNPACIFIDKHNRYWISTWNYASFVFDPATQQVNEFYHENENSFSVAGDFFRHIIEDEEGTLWLGTVNGLSYTNPDLSVIRLHYPFKNTNREPKLLRPIRVYFDDDKNNWWFSCINEKNLYQYNSGTGVLKTFSLSTDSFAIWGGTQFKNYLLLNASNGVHAFNTISERIEKLPAIDILQKAILNQSISWLYNIGDSVICVSAKSSGITQYNIHTQEIKTISLQQNDYLQRNIRKGMGDILSSNGRIYLAFTSLKIARYDVLQNKLDSLPVFFDSKINMNEWQSMGISEDKSGNLWIALNATGLVHLDTKTGKTKFWQQSDGLIYNFINSSAIDDSGRVWTAALNKFSVFDPRENSFENFSLPINENSFAYPSSLLTLHNGNILGNIDKLFIEWLPEKISRNTTAQPVLINKIIVNDSAKVLEENKTIRLKHTDNNFTIEFGILTGLDNNRYHLEYTLEGFEKKWNKAGPLNAAVYTNVPEKDFVFRVRVVAANGSWQGKETTFAIEVIPPFYRTTWFRTLAALLFSAVIVWLIRLRINSIRKAEAEKNDFNKVLNEWRLKALRSQMNPHFIFNCMNSIDMYILKNDAENASRYLNKFAKLVRLILSQSNDMYAPLSKEIEMLKYYLELEALRFDYPFTYTVDCSDELDPEETEIPSMLLQPYVENAILHGLRHKKAKGNLKVHISRENDNLFCVIEDDGVGRKRSAEINATRTGKHESRGTILAEERLKVMENKKNKPVINIIDLTDTNGNASGTRVEITIPMEFDY